MLFQSKYSEVDRGAYEARVQKAQSVEEVEKIAKEFIQKQDSIDLMKPLPQIYFPAPEVEEQFQQQEQQRQQFLQKAANIEMEKDTLLKKMAAQDGLTRENKLDLFGLIVAHHNAIQEIPRLSLSQPQRAADAQQQPS